MERRRIFHRTLAVAIGLPVGLVVAELGVRFAPGPIPPAVRAQTGLHDLRLVAEPHPELGYALRPGVANSLQATHDFTLFHLSTNRLLEPDVGFRTAVLEPGDGPPFAVAVGDSFAMGWGVEAEESFVSVLATEAGLSIANLGVVGYGPQQTARVALEHGLPLEPQLLVWFLYANDFQDAETFQNWVNDGRQSWWLSSKSSFDIWFARTAASYKLYKARAPYHSSSRHLWSADGIEYVFGRLPQTQVDLTRPEIRSGLDGLKRLWDELAPAATAVGVEVAVVALPHKELVHHDALAGWEGYDLLPRPAWTAAVDEALAHAERLGFATLDLLPVLEEHRGEQLFFPIDPHLTVRGNRVVGKALAGWFAERGWVAANR